MQDTNGNGSQLPEWMRNPQPARTTLTWRIGQAVQRNRLRRMVADLWRRFQARIRITQRYPKTAAVLAWPLSFITIMVVIAVIYKLYAEALQR